jgi:lysophospholipase L1-like esterase
MSLMAKLALSPLLAAQAALVRRRLPRLPEAQGRREGGADAGQPAARLKLLIAGDSSAAGVGVDTQDEALAGQLVRELMVRAKAPVHWRLVARSGVTTEQLIALLQQAAPIDADLAVIVTGVNDLVDQVPSRRAIQARDRLTNVLRNGHGVRHVVFCPLPPVHQFPSLPQPLRWLAGTDARRHNAALRHWAGTRRDVSHVPLNLRLNRGVMASDGFHPGEPVYRQVAIALADHLHAHLTANPRPAASSSHPQQPSLP